MGTLEKEISGMANSIVEVLLMKTPGCNTIYDSTYIYYNSSCDGYSVGVVVEKEGKKLVYLLQNVDPSKVANASAEDDIVIWNAAKRGLDYSLTDDCINRIVNKKSIDMYDAGFVIGPSMSENINRVVNYMGSGCNVIKISKKHSNSKVEDRNGSAAYVRSMEKMTFAKRSGLWTRL